jgi:hypothetical protein
VNIVLPGLTPGILGASVHNFQPMFSFEFNVTQISVLGSNVRSMLLLIRRAQKFESQAPKARLSIDICEIF